MFGYLRAIDFQALIGNVGGYIGLILGYTILQLPAFLKKVFANMKEKRFLNKQNSSKQSDEVGMQQTLPESMKPEPAHNIKTNDDMIELPKANFEQYDKKFNESFTELRSAIFDINRKIDELYQKLDI